jgi:hypothetical protein
VTVLYRGRNKTALASQTALAEALVSLMRQKPYQEISVSAICKEAGISRQTFYTLFDSKENVIDYELKKKHGFDPVSECSCNGSCISLRELCMGYSHYIEDKEPFMELLVKNDMTYCIQRSLYSSLVSCDSFFARADGDKRYYIAEFVAGGLTGVVKMYVLQEPRPDASELSEVIYSLLSGAAFENEK